MESSDTRITRRAFAGAAAFMIVPRRVLGGSGYVAPSDKITLASIGWPSGDYVTMELLARPEVQVVAVCDCNRGSKDYAEYSPTTRCSPRPASSSAPATRTGAKTWPRPERTRLTHNFETSLGMGGREPAKRLVEAYYASRNDSSYKGCTAYRDFRELLEKEKDLDAVYVATPDHWHAPISMAAMRKSKHVLCQKPMTHSIGEARRMAQLAREMKVATSLPVNNPSSDSTRIIREWLAGGAIGTVRQVHNWSSRPYWPQGVDRSAESMPVPDGLDWDLWLGPAPARPYNKAYLPFVWRGWYDFGCGSFGDMGCYSFAGLFKILDLTPPVAVEAVSSESYDETYPKASIVHLDFPAHNGRAALRMSWYDGGLRPPRPAGMNPADEHLFLPGEDGEGILYVGDRGYILAGFNGDNPRVYPESDKYKLPPRTPGPHPHGDAALDQWIAACKGGPAALANFEIQNPVTEAFLLGCMGQRFAGQRLEWDTANMRVTSFDRANQYVDPEYRKGYEA